MLLSTSLYYFCLLVWFPSTSNLTLPGSVMEANTPYDDDYNMADNTLVPPYTTVSMAGRKRGLGAGNHIFVNDGKSRRFTAQVSSGIFHPVYQFSFHLAYECPASRACGKQTADGACRVQCTLRFSHPSSGPNARSLRAASERWTFSCRHALQLSISSLH